MRRSTRRPSWLMKRTLLAALVVLLAATVVAQSSPPAPELLFVAPDRPAPGDDIVLTGTNLGDPGDTVVVHFAPDLTGTIKTRSSDTIRVTVPQGAKSGNVSLTVTRKFPDKVVIQNSNGLPVLVIWRTFNTDRLSTCGRHGLNALLSRNDDGID
jgi:hypothetical protein